MDNQLGDMKEDSYATIKLIIIGIMTGLGGWLIDHIDSIDKILAVVLKIILICSAVVAFAINWHTWKKSIHDKWKKGKKS